MKVMDKLSRILDRLDQAASVSESHVLAPFEIRLIAEAKLEKFAEFATSYRLSATDAKGDTPLHLTVREIAQELGDISRTAVIGKLTRLGLTDVNREESR